MGGVRLLQAIYVTIVLASVIRISDQTFVLDTAVSGCCGYLTDWRFYASTAGTVTAQLWRPTTGTNYQLVAEDAYTVVPAQEYIETPATAHAVETNDIIGWVTTGAEVVPHIVAGSSTQNKLITISVGGQASWAETPNVANTYAFGAVVTENVAPTVPDGTATIVDTDPSGTFVATIGVTDADTPTITDLTFTLTGTGASSFTILQDTTAAAGSEWFIETVGIVTAGTYTLTAEATDRCSYTDTGTFTITVDNTAPTFDPDPLATTHLTTVYDNTVGPETMYTFSVTDTDTITCSTTNTLFTLSASAPNWDLILIGDLDYDTATSALVDISCTDNVSTITSTYTIYVGDSDPVLTGLPATSAPLSDTTVTGTTIYTFTCQDSDDVVTVTIDAPENSQFGIDDSLPPAFGITTLLAFDYDVRTSYTVTVGCDDGTNTPVKGQYTVDLFDALPTFTAGIPGTGNVADDVSAETSLGIFTVSDPDAICVLNTPVRPYDVRTTAVTNPPEFEIIVVSDVTEAEVDYDLGSQVTLKVKCSDSTTTIFGDFVVTITDTPLVMSSFPATAYTDLPDSTTIGMQLNTFTVTDADDQSRITCEIDPTNAVALALFEIQTGTPPEFQIWVKDNSVLDAGTTPSYTFITSCNDGNGGNIVTGSTTVTVANAPPILTPAFPASSAPFSDGSAIGTSVYTFTCTDSDPVTVTIAAPEDTRFEIDDTAAPDYVIKTLALLDYTSMTIHNLDISCMDGTDTTTGQYTVNVEDMAPSFVDGVPGTGSVNDSVAGEKYLGVFTVSDPDANCGLNPAVIPFEIRTTAVIDPPVFEVWVASTVIEIDVNFDDGALVPLTIECSDATTTISGSFEVTIIDVPPVMAGLPGTNYTDLPDNTTVATKLDTFTVTDADDQSLINCDIDAAYPDARDSFEIRNGTSPEFQIWVKDGAPLNGALISSYTFLINCDDGPGGNVVTGSKTVTILDSPPSFTNLPDDGSVTVSESQTTRSLLYTVTCTDVSDVDFILMNPVNAAGISLKKVTNGPPYSETEVYIQDNAGLDFESSSGSITVNIRCHDQGQSVDDILTIFITNAAPVIINTGGSKNIPEDDAARVLLKTINLEAFDADATCSVTVNDGGPFTIDGYDLVKTATAVDYDAQQTYNILYECTEGLLTTTDSFTVYVDNVGPTVTNLPILGTINENITTELSLQVLVTSEPANDCYVTPPTYPEITVKLDPGTPDWTIFYTGEPLTQKFYTINVQCDDGTDTGPISMYYLRVIENEGPTFTNIVGIPAISLVAKNVAANDVVFSILTADVEGDPVNVTLLSCDPSATCPFQVLPNFDIIATAALATHPEHMYVLSIQIEDPYNVMPPKDLIIKIKDQNRAPTIINLDLLGSMPVKENLAAGTVIRDVTHVDPDVADNVNYECVFEGLGSSYFECTDDGKIITKSVLDYEGIAGHTFDVTVTAFDGYEYSETKTESIMVVNVNEPPVINNGPFIINKPDEGGHNQEVGCPSIGITDPDAGDSWSYTMNCPNGEGVFKMNRVTGCVTMSKEWDLDAAAKRLNSETIACTVFVTDKGGLISTSSLDIVINESDDNGPVLQPRQYTGLCAQNGSTSGTLSPTAQATDNDVQEAHKDLTWEIVGGGGPFSVNGEGVMSYGDISAYPSGTSFDMTIRVSDKAGHSDEGPVTVLIYDCPVPPTVIPVTTSSSVTTTNDIDNLLFWLVPVIVLLAILLGLLAYLIHRCWKAGRCCKSGPRAAKPKKIVQRAQTPPRSRKQPQGSLYDVDLPISHQWGRDIGNMGRQIH